MAYKRNPMRSERIASLARFVGSLEPNANQTHAVQFFERTLDDSANRRLAIPESFLATDAILGLMENVAAGLEVHPARIRRRLMDELPFMATEELIVRAVRAGGDRQDAHERIRGYSIAAARALKDGAATQRPARSHRRGRCVRHHARRARSRDGAAPLRRSCA